MAQQSAAVGTPPRLGVAKEPFEREAVGQTPDRAQETDGDRGIARRRRLCLEPHEGVADARHGIGEHRRAQRFAQRADVVVGHEGREVKACFVERARHVEPLDHGLKRALGRPLFAHRRDDERDDVAVSERDANDVPYVEFELARRIGERQIESGRTNCCEHVNDAHGPSQAGAAGV